MARWTSCNLLHVAPDAKRLWQFDAKGAGFNLAREQRISHAEALPPKGIIKTWSNYWQPKLNVAWLPLENVFLRVVELPAANADETSSMVELQLEKLSPIPVTQVVWTLHVFGTHQSPAKADGTTESLQTVIVVIAQRAAVEAFLGRLEKENFLADRLEVPLLDQLASLQPGGDSTWVLPLTVDGQNAGLVAWWCGGTLRSLSFVTLPPAGDRAAELKNQLSLLAMAGEVEGWLTLSPKWHLVADPVNAAEWENLLRTATGETVQVNPPPPPAELAARTATRTVQVTTSQNLLPAEFTTRYHQQFVDRLWLRALMYSGILYAIGCVIYFAAVGFRGWQTTQVEAQVAGMSLDYTNTVQLKARLAVLDEREKLKFAALDCWQLVAQQLPTGIQLQRLDFGDGQKLTLNGTVTTDDINALFEFDKSFRKSTINNQPVFDPQKGQHVNPRTGNNNTAYWSMSTELLHTDEEQP